MNRFIVKEISITKNEINYCYDLEGDWEQYFKEKTFNIEYSIDIETVPQSIAVVPLLANILPIAWIFNAEIVCDECDKDFFDSIPDFKKGYMDMYPFLSFKGKLSCTSIIENKIENQSGAVSFFSGGVDAFNTLIQHYKEVPTLITLWGSDVGLNDKEGWDKVEKHISKTSDEFGVDYVTVKSEFRRFLNEYRLSMYVNKLCGAGWWHDFQHGIGIISHAAPVMFSLKKKYAYFASSFTAADKGKVTCASDPTIDNYIRFCGAKVIHDGYEFNRQQKIENIVAFSNSMNRKIPLRVCWISKGGSNCCNCEKCWRTILGIYAEKANPNDLGFDIDSIEEFGKKFRERREVIAENCNARYGPIIKRIRENYDSKTINKGLLWFYNINFNVIKVRKFCFRVLNKIRRMLGVGNKQ